MNAETSEKLKFRWLPRLVIIFFILVLAAASAVLSFAMVFEKKYEGRIYPGVKIAGMDMGGKNFFEAEKAINDRINQAAQNGFLFELKEKTFSLMPINGSLAAETAAPLISWDPKEPLKQAFIYGRGNNRLENAKNIISAWKKGTNISLPPLLNDEAIMEELRENFKDMENPPVDARLEQDDGGFRITDDKPGISIDYRTALEVLKNKSTAFDQSPTELILSESEPAITKAECEKLELTDKAVEIVSLDKLSFTDGSKEWAAGKKEISGWLKLGRSYHFCSEPQTQTATGTETAGSNLEKYGSACQNPADSGLLISVNKEKVLDFVDKKIAKEVEVDPVDAKFEIKDGRVTEFQTAKDGKKIDRIATLHDFEYALLISRATSVPLTITKVASAVTQESVNDLGIKEKIGTGHSNFKGSPKNRRHNIATGAKRLHGVIIGPGEEFSMIKTLGSIDAKNGYLPELVIKGNKTTPEYGGGLCQIGTTAFRTAVNSGLPITERRNHSYRVSYYEPAGTDATIYDPKPDFRFKNDTAHSVLIQTRIEGNDLYFDFWGTKDGRAATSTYPKIYNIVKPGPTKIVETKDLKPGEKKCTEKAHNGADAYFDYKVTYPDGAVKDVRFSSHYVPWREVCLVGVDPAKKSASTTAETKAD